MAQGDVVLFNKFYESEGLALHNLASNDLKLGLVTNAITPAAATADPRWGTGGATNFAAQQVTVGGTYLDGGTSVNPTFSETGGVATLRGDNVSWVKDNANPTDAFWGILYDNTDTGKRCIGFVELGGPINMQQGDLTINWNAAGIATKQAA